jgi:transposase-like protein
MAKTRFSAVEKVKILREYLENNVSVSQLSEKLGIHPNLIYKWKNDLFAGALKTFSGEHSSKTNKEAIRVKKLEEKLKERDSLITEIVTENVRLKKNFSGEI